MDDLRHGLVHQPVQGLDGLDGARPIVLRLVDADQRAQRRQGVASVLELLETALGAIEHAGLQEVLGQFVLRVLALGGRQIGSVQEALVHTDGALHLAAAPEQAAQREVQFGRLGIELGDLDKGVDGSVRLFIEQEIQPAKIESGRLRVSRSICRMSKRAASQPSANSTGTKINHQGSKSTIRALEEIQLSVDAIRPPIT